MVEKTMYAYFYSFFIFYLGFIKQWQLISINSFIITILIFYFYFYGYNIIIKLFSTWNLNVVKTSLINVSQGFMLFLHIQLLNLNWLFVYLILFFFKHDFRRLKKLPRSIRHWPPGAHSFKPSLTYRSVPTLIL